MFSHPRSWVPVNGPGKTALAVALILFNVVLVFYFIGQIYREGVRAMLDLDEVRTGRRQSVPICLTLSQTHPLGAELTSNVWCDAMSRSARNLMNQHENMCPPVHCCSCIRSQMDSAALSKYFERRWWIRVAHMGGAGV